MLKKLQVLAGALRLTVFTVAELSKACGVSQNTVHTALNRVPQDWLKSTVVPGRTRGGQRRRYTLSSAGISAIRGMLGRLPSADSSILVEPTDEPVGLSAARASLERIAQVNPRTARILREDALRSLEWAEAEIRDGAFASDARLLRARIDDLRTRIESLSEKNKRTPRRDMEVLTARSDEHLHEQGHPARQPPGVLTRADALPECSNMDDSKSAPIFFIGYLYCDDRARQMASFADGALSYELHKRGEHRFVTEALELPDLFESRIANLAADVEVPVRLLICIGRHWNSPEIHPILEKASRFNEKGSAKRAWVLDHEHRTVLEDATRMLSLSYEPYAQVAEHLTRWVDATISDVDLEVFATAALEFVQPPRSGVARTAGPALGVSGHAPQSPTLVPVVPAVTQIYEEKTLPPGWGVSVNLREVDLTMERLERAFTKSETVTGIVTGSVKGGFTVEIKNVRAFLPGSLVDAQTVRDIPALRNKPLDFKVIKLDRTRRLVVVSRSAASGQEFSAGRSALTDNSQGSPVVHDPVQNTTDYGYTRTIRRYPNKRLYDTVESRYITLSDIRRLVRDRVNFVVIDKKRQEDITRSILLQVIAEHEQGDEPVMSRDFMSEIIRAYGGATQGMIGSYLEQSLKLFEGQQRDTRKRSKAGRDAESASAGNNQAVNHLAQKNYQRWRQVQDEIYRTLTSAYSGRSDLVENDEVSGIYRVPAGAPDK